MPKKRGVKKRKIETAAPSPAEAEVTAPSVASASAVLDDLAQDPKP